MHEDRARWNAKYRSGLRHPICVNLIMHLTRLTRGRALDVAGGVGENAAVLAMAGFDVTMSDLSDEAVVAAARRSRDLRAPFHVVHADASFLPFRAAFDTVVCAYFLDRSIDLAARLRPGGTLFVENFTVATLRYKPDFRRSFCLEEGELRRLFAGLEELLYKEEDDGAKVTATLIARRP
jgi:2-polyprenyl-3-methyl-5-hydroxy-6-metoxy-1,4-benzoquinol methylase